MGETIYTYSFPFRDELNQHLILESASSVIRSSVFSKEMAKAKSDPQYVRESSNNNLTLFLPVPRRRAENATFNKLKEEYLGCLVTVSRVRPAREDEEITIEGRFIATDVDEYSHLLQSGTVSGLAELAIPIALESSEPEFTRRIFPHRVNIEGVNGFSNKTKKTVHQRQLMNQIGTVIGGELWNEYSRGLTRNLDVVSDSDLRFWKVSWNNQDTHHPNSQYVATFKDACLIVCEELQYEASAEAIPRYGVIPVSSFDRNIYQAVDYAFDRGMDTLNGPGIHSYMRMRPSLTAAPGHAAGAALREALEAAKSLYGGH